MGKGLIIDGGTDGLYDVQLILDRKNITTIIEKLDSQISHLEIVIDEMAEGREKQLAILKKNALIKKKEYTLNAMPDDPIIETWCADLTEDLSGYVGTIEIPGERRSVNIQPGYGGNAVYDPSRDGILQPSIASCSAAVTFYNMAMLPGWQKWMPTFRYGTITSIDSENDTCSVTLDSTGSIQHNLNINYVTTLKDVPIQYMNFNSLAFSVGDQVIIQFSSLNTQTANNWSTGIVIGFKNNPKIYEEPTNDFLPLGQTSRNWYAMADAPNGNIYACVWNGDIYMQTGGVGNFIALGQTSRKWTGITVTSGGDVYATVDYGDIYMQTGGVGNFIALGQTSRRWNGIAWAFSGNVYACENLGDIYMQTGGVGNFIALGLTSRNWYAMTGAPNGDVYACGRKDIINRDIYMQTGGVGAFVALNQSNRNWYSITGAASGNIYAGAYGGDIYMQTAGAGDFLSLSQGNRNWLGLTGVFNINIYACVYGGDIYMQDNT